MMNSAEATLLLDGLRAQAQVIEDDIRELTATEEHERKRSGTDWMAEADRIKRELERRFGPLRPANGPSRERRPVDRSGALKKILLLTLTELA